MIFVKDDLSIYSEYNEIKDKQGVEYWQFWRNDKVLYVKKIDAGQVFFEDEKYRLEVKQNGIKMILFGSTLDEIVHLYLEGIDALQSQNLE